MNAQISLNWTNKTATATRDYMLKAAMFGTTEFNQLQDLRAKGFRIEERTIARNAEKQTYGKLDYDAMRKYIRDLIQIAKDNGDEAAVKEQEERLKQLEKVIVYAKKTQTAAYVYVKKWFLGFYGKDEKFLSKKERDERQKAKELEAKIAAGPVFSAPARAQADNVTPINKQSIVV